MHCGPPDAPDGLAGGRARPRVRTTVSNPAAACPLGRVNRQFRAPRPNALWLSDFTYVATWQGFSLYPTVLFLKRTHEPSGDLSAKASGNGSC
jgi:transposase InsO family protein